MDSRLPSAGQSESGFKQGYPSRNDRRGFRTPLDDLKNPARYFDFFVEEDFSPPSSAILLEN
jgi:hypothetical protein